MRYLTKNEIIFVNRQTLIHHGGHFKQPNNFLNEAPLDYLIDIVSSEMFGQPLYPSLDDKAALYMYNIIANHIFQDGNKRTGLEAAILFLDLNGHRINRELSKKEVYDFTILIASGLSSLESCQEWFKLQIVRK